MSSINIGTELEAKIQRAREAGAALDVAEPRAVAAWYESELERVFIELKNGVVIGFPYRLLQGLENATPEQLAEVEISPSGYGLHWESLDVDLGVPQLAAGLFGTQKWMAELGRKGGQAKSTAKAEASRNNGKRGGRPKKSEAPVSPQQEITELRKLINTEDTAQNVSQEVHVNIQCSGTLENEDLSRC
jgi:hypothetical protein